MVYRAFIFDLDGTLVHTLPEYRYLIVGKTLSSFGKTASKKHIDKFWFKTGRDSIIREKFVIDPDMFWKEYEKHDTPELRKLFVRLYKDIEFIKELKQKGCKIGIVTGAPKFIIDMYMELIGRENFDAVIRAQLDGGIRPKPHPQGLKKCLSVLGAKEDEAVFIGNAEEDILAAQNIGVFDVLLDRGEHEVKGINPSLTIKSIYELDKFISSS